MQNIDLQKQFFRDQIKDYKERDAVGIAIQTVHIARLTQVDNMLPLQCLSHSIAILVAVDDQDVLYCDA